MKDLFFKTIMLKGEAGGTISKIEKTGSSLNVDTYTITLNDGETQTFEVTNGSSIASIEKTDTSGLLDTYTVTLTDGSTTQFVVRNGEDGAGYEVPAGSVLFYDPDGDDSAPEGYEASSDPNGAAIAALQRGLDNNLLLHGDLMNISSDKYTYGWTFDKDGDTNMPGIWAPVMGLMINAGVKGVLRSPRMSCFEPFPAFNPAPRFSVSVLFTFIDYPVSDPTPEPYYIAKIEDIDPANLEDAVYTLPGHLEIKVVQIGFGGYFRLHLDNLSASSYDIAIKAVKLEIGPTATDIKYITPQTGLEDALAQFNEPYSGLTWFHDSGANTKSMSGALSAVGTWITDNFISNKWIGCKVVPTDSSGYFGSSSFSVLANCSSANYGVAQLMSDNPNKSALVIGQLVGGTWSWKAVSTTAIS